MIPARQAFLQKKKKKKKKKMSGHRKAYSCPQRGGEMGAGAGAGTGAGTGTCTDMHF